MTNVTWSVNRQKFINKLLNSFYFLLIAVHKISLISQMNCNDVRNTTVPHTCICCIIRQRSRTELLSGAIHVCSSTTAIHIAHVDQITLLQNGKLWNWLHRKIGKYSLICSIALLCQKHRHKNVFGISLLNIIWKH